MFQNVDAIYEDGVLKPLEPINLMEHQRVQVSIVLPTEAPNGAESFFDVASRLGFIGCIKGTPPDLSTNKAYFKDFGKRDE